jgi:alpha-galactosidase
LKLENGTMKDINIAYIGGGSRGWAWGFMMDLAMDSEMVGTVRLYDIDSPAAEKNKIIGTKISDHPDAKAKWNYVVTNTLKEALTGADVVVISILPGTMTEMRSDVHYPERYNIWQPVGDTVGPGGFVRAMRTVPMFVEFAQAIQAYSPDAWVMNYTNPMSACVATLYEVFPQIHAYGCCHEVFGTQKLLAAMLNETLGIADVTRQEIHVNVTGVNHFTWLSSASYHDIDLFPLYTDLSKKYYESGYYDGQDNNWMNDSFACAHRVKFDLFQRFNQIAAAGDRHLAEFVPSWYARDPETVKSFLFGLTSVDWREADLAKRLKKSDEMVADPITITPSGEEGHLLLKALLGLGDLISNVNIPNEGQIENLDRSLVVETNALFCKGAIRPISAGPLAHNIQPLISRVALNQRNTVQAAISCDFKLALSTFLNDPMLAKLTPLEGEELLTAMLSNTKAFLPGWKNI